MTLYVTAPYRRLIRRRWMDPTFDSNESGDGRLIRFPVDVKEEPDAYVIAATLPGVTSEDLDVRVVNETITIQGEIKDSDDEKAGYLVRERPSGRFSRTLTLPDELDADKAEADLRNGVLTLRVPKAEQARPRTIKVNSN